MRNLKPNIELILFYREVETSAMYNLYLKMLGLYLYILIIVHKSCNMLSILNKLTLQKKKSIFWTNNVFLDKKVKTQQQQNQKSNIKTLAATGI